MFEVQPFALQQSWPLAWLSQENVLGIFWLWYPSPPCHQIFLLCNHMPVTNIWSLLWTRVDSWPEQPQKKCRNFMTSGCFIPVRQRFLLHSSIYNYIAIYNVVETFDGMWVTDPWIEKFRKTFLWLFRARANNGAKQKVKLQTFVLEGHPRIRGHAKVHCSKKQIIQYTDIQSKVKILN